MSRRGFFKRVFGGPVKQSMLAVQVVVPVYALTDFRAKLHNVIEGTHHEVHGPDEKRVYYRKIVTVLEQALAHFEGGRQQALVHVEGGRQQALAHAETSRRFCAVRLATSRR